MRRGTVKWFNAGRGFGFVIPDDGGGDVMVHVTVLREQGFVRLRPGQRVQFQTSGQERVTWIGIDAEDGSAVEIWRSLMLRSRQLEDYAQNHPTAADDLLGDARLMAAAAQLIEQRSHAPA